MRHLGIAGAGVLVLASIAAGQSAPPRVDAEEAIVKFTEGLPRDELLQTLRTIVGANPAFEGEYGELLKDLALPDDPPPGYKARPEERSEEERIAAWIYDLRDMPPREMGLPDSRHPTVEDRLIAAGPAALDQLVRSATGRTVTRSMPIRHSTESNSLLRRGDLAARIAGRIIGAPQMTAATAAQLAPWWLEAKGKSQAEGLRLWNKRNLSGENATMFALIEGSADDINALRAIQQNNLDRGGSGVSEALNLLDRRSLVHTSLDRFWQLNTRRFDLSYVSTYGDQRVYAEIARRLDEGKERALWTHDINSYPNRGGVWAIPILIATLQDALDAPEKNNGDTIMTQAGDHAIEQLATLIGQDFGFAKGQGYAVKQVAAYQKAVDWWKSKGKDAYAGKLADVRPTPADGTDLLDADDLILARVGDISDNNDITARRAVTSLPKTFSSEVQRALLNRLKKETVAAERRKILAKFGAVALWEGPALAEVFEKDPDEAASLSAADLLLMLLSKSTIDWQYRLEPREAVLAAARRVAANTQATPPTRRAALQLMITWDSFQDREAAEKLAADASLKDEPSLKAYLANN